MKKLNWYKVLNNKEELPENRVMTVTAGHKQIALSHFEGKICALDNSCPHQGGPLGEGSIENGILRCPWHGWDYHPCTGKAPGFDDGVDPYEVKEEDGAIYVGLMEEEPHQPTISDVMMETMVNWGVDTVFGMVGHSNLGVADAMNRITPENAVIAVDVGNNIYSFGRYFECKNQSILMSGYLGSIGFALPAAMGAWAAVKNSRPVWSVSGDGALGIRVEKREHLEAAMQKIKDHDGPALLDVVCDVSLI